MLSSVLLSRWNEERMKIGERDPGKFAGAIALAIAIFTVVGLSAGHVFHSMKLW